MARPFFSRALKCKFPFSENEVSFWNKSPRLNAAFSQVARNTDLAFEDMGALSDLMDKRMDLPLKTWEYYIGNLKLTMAVMVVAYYLEYYLTQIKVHIEAGRAKDTNLTSFPMRDVLYNANDSAESVRMSTRSSALANSARRVLWLKTWQGDSAPKVKLCGIPLTGDLLFDTGLGAILDRMADKEEVPAAGKMWCPKS